jgi:hypothetical protein
MLPLAAPLELTLLGVSIAAILAIFAAEFFRIRPRGSVRLSGSMLFAFRILLGIVFTILGVIGSLLPIMQGWVFFLLAALVLFPQSRFAIRALEKAEPKAPRAVALLRRFGIGVSDREGTTGTGTDQP